MRQNLPGLYSSSRHRASQTVSRNSRIPRLRAAEDFVHLLQLGVVFGNPGTSQTAKGPLNLLQGAAMKGLAQGSPLFLHFYDFVSTRIRQESFQRLCRRPILILKILMQVGRTEFSQRGIVPWIKLPLFALILHSRASGYVVSTKKLSGPSARSTMTALVQSTLCSWPRRMLRPMGRDAS